MGSLAEVEKQVSVFLIWRKKKFSSVDYSKKNTTTVRAPVDLLVRL
uniref:Uncharacterized protein n=1 Tax=Brugia timori TaxID=42155 RepID=A0A0R3QWQ4_9BILA